jgi:transposase
MLIIGCDYHPGFKQIAFVDTETGECGERRLTHPEEAEQFYNALKGRSVRVGMEASGHSRWFERLLRDLQFELWIGDAAEIRTKRVRKQKTDRQDAQLLLRLMMEDRFPRIWVPDAANRDLRQLLWHRHRLVQMRTRGMNQLHVVALNEGLRRKKALWRPAGRNQLESLKLAPWASRRRQEVQRYRPIARKIEPIVRLPDTGQSFGAFGAFLEAFDFLAIGPGDELLWVRDQRSSQIYAMKRRSW